MSHTPNVLDRIDDLTPTDLWSDIEQRRAGPEPAPPVSSSRRMTVIAVAFLIAVAAIVAPIVVITRSQKSAPIDSSVDQHGVARSPMGIPIVVTYPPDWYAENVFQPANLDPTVDSEKQVGLVISNSQEAMPALLVGTASSESAGALPDDPNLPSTFVTVTILTDEGRPVSWEDSSLPLSMDDGKAAPGLANIRSLDAQIGGVPLTIEVQGGPQASNADLAAAEEIVASIQASGTESGFPTPDGPVTVPDLIGLQISEAIRAAEDAGLTVGTIQVLDDSKLGEPGADDVVSQEPAPGTTVDPGTEVSVSVTAMPHSGPAPLDPNDPALSRRLGVYEAMIRSLVKGAGAGTIHVESKLCGDLIGSLGGKPCSDQLTSFEQDQLISRLSDLGVVRFIDGSQHNPTLRSPNLLLGPIVETSDGIRVEAAVLCGGLCGGGSVYIVVPDGDGYAVVGTDDSYGSWVA